MSIVDKMSLKQIALLKSYREVSRPPVSDLHMTESDRFVANYLCEEWKKYVESCANADKKQPAPDEEGSGERTEAGYIEWGRPAGDRQRIYGWDEGVASLPDEYFKSVSEPTDERIGGMEPWPDGVSEEE